MSCTFALTFRTASPAEPCFGLDPGHFSSKNSGMTCFTGLPTPPRSAPTSPRPAPTSLRLQPQRHSVSSPNATPSSPNVTPLGPNVTPSPAPTSLRLQPQRHPGEGRGPVRLGRFSFAKTLIRTGSPVPTGMPSRR